MAVTTILEMPGIRLEVEYDETTISGDDAALTRFILTCDREVSLSLRRSASRGVWHNVIVPEGVHTFNAGGPVRRFSDLSSWTVGVVW